MTVIVVHFVKKVLTTEAWRKSFLLTLTFNPLNRRFSIACYGLVFHAYLFSFVQSFFCFLHPG